MTMGFTTQAMAPHWAKRAMVSMSEVTRAVHAHVGEPAQDSHDGHDDEGQRTGAEDEPGTEPRVAGDPLVEDLLDEDGDGDAPHRGEQRRRRGEAEAGPQLGADRQPPAQHLQRPVRAEAVVGLHQIGRRGHRLERGRLVEAARHQHLGVHGVRNGIGRARHPGATGPGRDLLRRAHPVSLS